MTSPAPEADAATPSDALHTRVVSAAIASRRTVFACLAGWIILSATFGVWAALGAGTPLDQPADLPAGPVSTVDRAFSNDASHTLIHLVLESSSPLGDSVHDYYDALVRQLRNDRIHVAEVLAPWSDPLSAAVAEGPGGTSSYALVWLNGASGSIQMDRSIDAVRQGIDNVPAVRGVRAVVTAPDNGHSLHAAVAPMVWSAVVAVTVLAAASIALCRPLTRGVLIAVAPCAALMATIPLLVLLHRNGLLTLTGTSLALALVITGGAAAEFARLLTLAYARRRQRALEAGSALALAVTDSAGAVAALTSGSAVILCASIFMRSPLLHGAGVPAAIGIVIACASTWVLMPAATHYTRHRPTWQRQPPAATPISRRLRRATRARPRRIAAISLAIMLAAAVTAGSWGYHHFQPHTTAPGSFPADRLQPEIVTISSDHDLRTPQGLIAIDQVTRAIVALPGIQRVRSASWPAGKPWVEATFARQAGELGKQLQRNAASITSQLTSIKTLSTTLDQLGAAVSRLQSSITAGSAGLRQITGAGNDITAGVSDLRATTQSISGQLNPIRDLTNNIPNCPADALCATALKLIEPVDNVVRGVTVVTDGAQQLQAGSVDVAAALVRTPQAVTQMRQSLDNLRGLIPGLTDTIDSVLPQLVQLTSFLKNVSLDFKDSGEGGFYAPRKLLNDPSYQAVKQSLFTDDGHATRLFVYGDLHDATLAVAARPNAIKAAVRSSTKFGELAATTVAVAGVGSTRHTLDELDGRDAAVLSLVVLLVAIAAGALGVRPRWAVVVALVPVAAFWGAYGALVAVTAVLERDSADLRPGLLVAYLLSCAVTTPYALASALRARQRQTSALLPATRGAPGILSCVGAGGFGLVLAVQSGSGSHGPLGLTVLAAMVLATAAVPASVTAIASATVPEGGPGIPVS